MSEAGANASACPISRFFPHPLAAAAFTLAFAGYWFAARNPFFNPDTAWHLAAGQWMLQHRSIPVTDPWSYTAGHTRWINLSWLWDIIIALAFKSGGMKALFGFGCFVGALNIAAIVWTLKARASASDLYIMLIALLAGFGQLTMLFPQPQLLTFLLAILFSHIMHFARRDGIWERSRMLCLGGISLIWANTHGGFITAFTILAAYAAEAYYAQNTAWLKQMGKLTLLCLLACLCNPYHLFVFEGVMRTLNSCITPYLADWHPFDFENLALALPLTFFLLSSNVREPSIRLADKILAFGWLIAGLATVRNFNLFLMLGAPYFAYNLQAFARAAQGPRFREVNVAAHSYNTPGVSLYALATIVILTGYSAGLGGDPARLNPDPDGTFAALKTIKMHYPQIRFYNDYNLGGYLDLYDMEQADNPWLVFVDGRAGTAYPESVLQDALDFNASSAQADAVIRKYNVQGLLLLQSNPRVRDLLRDEKWRQVFNNTKLVAFIQRAE